MRDEALERKTMELIRELAHPTAGPLAPETTLGSIGFDSLAFVELASAVEEGFGIDLGGAALDASATVGDVLVAVRLAGPTGSAEGVPKGVGRLQGAVRLSSKLPLRWWLDLRVVGAEGVPGTGPVVLAMNHESALDIPVSVLACPRPITFMAKRELFKGAFTSRSLHELGGFRVDRDRFDLRAVRVAMAVLDRGEVLGMYPEGTRSPGELLPFLHGAAWLALRSGAPLVPVAISGTELAERARRPRRVRVRVTFAPTIEVEPVPEPGARRRRAEALTSELRAAVEAGLSH
jgi:1-acyl-sn-glycerol-3-phosphate acyltransferase